MASHGRKWRQCLKKDLNIKIYNAITYWYNVARINRYT
jgi:hypothetical protein